MAPHLGRIAFNPGMLVLVMAVISLPFLALGSAAFVAALVALVVAAVFLGIVAWHVRRQAHLAGKRTQKGITAGPAMSGMTSIVRQRDHQVRPVPRGPDRGW